LKLDQKETLIFAKHSVYDPIIHVFTQLISILCVLTLIFSGFILFIINFLPFMTQRFNSLRFMFFFLGHNIVIISSLSLIDFSFPDNLESFVIALYKFTFGIDDFYANNLSNIISNEPNFYRNAKSNSLIANIPCILFIHMLCLFLLLLVKFIENQPGIYKRWKSFSKMFSLGTMFILFFPFLLDIFMNSTLCIRAFFISSSDLWFDFLLSIVYISLILYSIIN
jgi:hypothetical protein